MSKLVIVNANDIKGEIQKGFLVHFNGEPFKVVDSSYKDESGVGVLLECIYNEKVVNFELERNSGS